MSRRRKGRAVDGWLVLDKPYDMGSTEAVSKLRWMFDARKAGHAGTLDPLATGLLPIAFGEATKTVPYVQDGLKTYRFTAKWGEQTTTDDREGEVVDTHAHRPDEVDIDAVLERFTGTIRQKPPAFSAIKVDGERAYDLARDGEAVDLPEREVTIEVLRLIDLPSEDEAVFEAVTGKGTYVRALVRDIALALGTVAHVAALRRTTVGPFTEDMAVTFEEMTDGLSPRELTPDTRQPERYDEFLLGIDAAMRDYPQVAISRAEAARLSVGGDAILGLPQVVPIRQGEAGDIEPILAVEHDRPIALCRLEGLKLRPVKVFAIGG
jgi:tRNA pseudouridine55 synthase